MKDALITVISTLAVFVVLIFIHEFGHFIAARICGVGVKEFSIGMGPKLFSWKSKKYDTLYGVKALPIGGYVSMIGEDEASDDASAFCNKSLIKRAFIIFAGPLMNITLAFVLMAIVVLSQANLASTVIAEFNEDALSSGKLEVGDKIVAVDGVPVFTGNDAAYEIMNQGYEPIDIKVKRNGETVLVEDVSFGHFEESGVTFGDCDFKFLKEEKNPLVLAKHVLFRSVSTVKMTLDSVFALVTGRYGLDAVSGPVGVAEVVGEAVGLGFINFIYLVSVLSANLGVLNLVPFPALDGGRLLFLAIEGVRGKPIKKEVEGYINFVGLILLFAFVIVVFGKDILSLIRR